MASTAAQTAMIAPGAPTPDQMKREIAERARATSPTKSQISSSPIAMHAPALDSQQTTSMPPTYPSEKTPAVNFAPEAATAGHLHTHQPETTTAAVPGTANALQPTAAGAPATISHHEMTPSSSTSGAAASTVGGHTTPRGSTIEHDKARKASLKVEIKNEKALERVLESDEKAEAKEITAALAKAKTSVKEVERRRKAEDKLRKAHEANLRKEDKVKQAFLKAEEAYKAATLHKNRSAGELDIAEKSHKTALATRDEDAHRVEELQHAKIARDAERNKRHVEASAHLEEAKRELAMAPGKKFLCF